MQPRTPTRATGPGARRPRARTLAIGLIGAIAAIVLASPAQAVLRRGANGHVISYQRVAPIRGHRAPLRPATSPATSPTGALGAVTTTSGTACTTSTSTTPCLSYFTGPIMRWQHLTAVYWDPTGSAFPTGYESEMNTFFSDLAAASGASDNFMSVLTQYYEDLGGGNGYLGYTVTAGTPIVDTHAYPTSATDTCTDPFPGITPTRPCISDQGIQDEINRLLSADTSLPAGIGNEYVMFFPPGVDTCQDSAGSACGGVLSGGYCGYHSATFVRGFQEIEYANEPEDGDPAFNGACDAAGNVGSDDAHATMNTTSHEISESASDPEPGYGWYDLGTNSASQQWGEVGDICAWSFQQGDAPGSFSLDPPSGGTNQTINGDKYLLQVEWDNQNSTCSVSAGAAGDPTGPAAAFTLSPGSTVSTGQAITPADTSTPATGTTITSWQWDFGDGTVATLSDSQAPPHSYASTGTSQSATYTITLTVTDSNGNHSTTSRPVTVTDRPPQVDFTVPAGATAGTPVGFLASASDPDGTISSYAWSWSGNGASGSSSLAGPSFTFPSAGTYSVTLTVTDNSGSTSSATHQVSVAAPPSSGGATSGGATTTSGGTTTASGATTSTTTTTTVTPATTTTTTHVTTSRPATHKKKKKHRKKHRRKKHSSHHSSHKTTGKH